MMKRYSILPFFAGALLAAACPVQPCRAAGDHMADETVTTPDAVSVIDPVEEAHKIRRLVKLALASNATEASHDVLNEEIAIIEKNKKLKMNVLTSLLQDDSPDPTLPKVELVKYPDGSVRGLLFIQTDNVRANNPNRLAWAIDPKREHKEQSR
jgi:hypothetical protein